MGSVEEGPGQGQAADPGRNLGLQGFCRLFQRGPGREDVVDQENRFRTDPGPEGNPEGLVKIELAGLPAEKALGRGGAPLREAPFLYGEVVASRQQAFPDPLGQQGGLVKFPLPLAAGVERDGEDQVVTAEARPAFQEKRQGPAENLEKVPSAVKFNPVDKVFD